jgi:predicted transcriptional regulator
MRKGLAFVLFLHGVASGGGEKFFPFRPKDKAMRHAHAVIFSFLLALGLAPLPVFAQVFKCVDDDGKVTYSNEGGSIKGCKQLSGGQSVSTISMRASPAPAAFPKISDDVQKERDKTRRQVLEKELDNEQLALEGARKGLAEQEAVRYGDEKNYQKVLDRLQPYKDIVERHERNIEALTQELSGLR